jgi:integration host factor subunit beta
MTKSELARRLAGSTTPRLTLRDAAVIVTAIFDEIAAGLSDGGRVELRGFGVFSTKRVSARRSRNPLTGDSVSVPEKHFVIFKTGKPMHHRLNG